MSENKAELDREPLFTLVYFPICFYCDWRELRGEHECNHVKLLNQVRCLCFTSILLPTTAHCMHTVSLIVVLTDLVLVKRERPKSNVLNIGVLSSFLIAYTVVCVQSVMKGEYIYPGLKLFTGMKFPILVIYVFLENFFYYTSQWLVVDIVWGQGNLKKVV
ncbi:hypothetical protein HF086_003652 [Spodoptera exigua]|uniref:Uncharacterized protein n=1 Tax=Spodoptera exigua TaxID=7107 RepID=A0A922S9E8_SPOEX|nr:hypothetical protein HF086_003652 [Spodoptera exigua]